MAVVCLLGVAAPAEASTISAAEGDGSRVFFATDESLLPADTDGSIDIYERSGGSLALETIGDPVCQPGCGNGNIAVDVTDGLEVVGPGLVFSTAESLLPADADSAIDIYLHTGGGLQLLSQGPNGFNGAFDATLFSASPDGTAVVFSTAEQMAGADTDSSIDLYARRNGTTTLLSQGPNGFNGAFDAMPAANSDAESAVFFRTAERLVSADTDSSIDLYERTGNTTTLVSQGAEPYNGAFNVDPRVRVSSSGAHVLFSTAEPLAALDEDTLTDAYLRSGEQTRMASKGAYSTFMGEYEHPVQIEALDSTENLAIYSTKEVQTEDDRDASSVDVYEWLYGQTSNGANGFAQTTLISTAGHPFTPEPVDAEFLQFASSTNATFFSTPEAASLIDTDSSPDIYEGNGGVAKLVSQGPNGFNGPFTPTLRWISADGSRVRFTTAEQLVSTDTDNSVDLYERINGETTVLVSAGRINGNGSFDVTAWGSGENPLFSTGEKLVSGDTDNQPDLYERSGGTTHLVSTGEPSPPPPTLTGSDPASPSNDNAPSIHGEAKAGARVELFAAPDCSGALLASGSAAQLASPGLSISVPDDSSTSVYAQQTDSNGYVGECSAALTYVEDSTASPPILTATDPAGPSNHNAPRIRGAAEAGSSVQLFTTPGCEGPPSAVGSAAELSGAGIQVAVPTNARTEFSARAFDSLGNVSACSTSQLVYAEDSTPPETTIVGGPGRRTREARAIFFFKSSEPGGTFRCHVDAKPVRTCGAAFKSPRLAPGRHTLEVTAVDGAGNADPTPETFTFRVLKKARGHRYFSAA